MRVVFALPLVFVACKSSASRADSPPGTHTLVVHTGFTGDVPVGNTCDGNDTIPQISYENTPPAAKAMAFIVDDPDAPGGTFTHYLAWNTIPGGEKTGVTGTNDFGNDHWNGPCPPPGKAHHYHFRVYALDGMLDLKAGAKRAALDEALAGHVLADGEVVATYSRKVK